MTWQTFWCIIVDMNSDKPALHVVGLPHNEANVEHVSCAYQQKHRKFVPMMMNLGYEVYSYAGEHSDMEATEHIVVSSDEDKVRWFGNYDHHKDFYPITWGENDVHWVESNRKAIEEISKRAKPKDIICLIAGNCQRQIAYALPNLQTVEYGIGYYGVFANFKVFESYSHMHHVYGYGGVDNGGWYDAVIHNYFNRNDFYLGDGSGEYLLFIGRYIERKGVEIAVKTAQMLDMPLVMAGQGAKQEGDTISALDGSMKFKGSNLTHVGHVNVEERAALMADAKATIIPTIYVEPFGGVSVESMMAGTPVIASDFGAFTETVKRPAGLRFRTIGEAAHAIEEAASFDRADIRRYAIENFSCEAAAIKYDMYFEQLGTLWGDGFYSDWYPTRRRYENE